MKSLELILANMIRSGKVTVEIPGIVFSDEMEDGEKIACLREMLEP